MTGSSPASSAPWVLITAESTCGGVRGSTLVLKLAEREAARASVEETGDVLDHRSG